MVAAIERLGGLAHLGQAVVDADDAASLLTQRLNINKAPAKPPLNVRLGKALGLSQQDPAAGRAKVDALVERFGAKPLISFSLNVGPKGTKLESVKVSPTFGFKDFDVTKRFKSVPQKKSPSPKP